MFVPAAVMQVGEDRTVQYLMEGYVFVRREAPDAAYMRLEGTRYVDSVLTKPGGQRGPRQIACVTTADIEKMRRQIRAMTDQGIAVGDTVYITNGPYRQLTAEVFEDIPERDTVQVFIRFRSKEAIVSLPRSFLTLVQKAPLKPEVTRFKAIKTWWEDARPAFVWQARKFDPIRQKFDALRQLEGFVARRKAAEVVVVDYLRPIGVLEEKYREVSFLDDLVRRAEALSRGVLELERQLKGGPLDNIQNLIIDGHNLACRCAMAPGLCDLRDTQGRPTGGIIGFLNSLKGLMKRFPTASPYVTWDGSSQVRRRMYAGYKATRSPNTQTFETTYLREMLPSLGVRQAWNPEEEADDVIGALVRGPLAGQRNLIVGTDQDMLQLVSSTDNVLFPQVGARKEILHTPETVVQEYGVEPSRLVQLRALLGDTSDKIPGVPRVPVKILTALVQAHGSVEGILKSNLIGLTPSQYEKIRASADQLRLNVRLMTLRTEIPLTVLDPNPDPAVATQRLQDVNVKVEPILSAFLRV